MSKQIAIALLAVIAIVFVSGACLSDESTSAEAIGSISADSTVDVILDDTTHGYILKGNGNVTITDKTITSSDAPAIEIVGSITLILSGNNELKPSSGYAGIFVSNDNSLTIGGTGKLKIGVTGDAAAIGGTGKLKIGVTGDAAAIGGNDVSDFHSSGSITINSGTFEIDVTGDGAAIGGACYGTGNVTINGGDLKIKTSGVGAAIGSGAYRVFDTTEMVKSTTGEAYVGGTGVYSMYNGETIACDTISYIDPNKHTFEGYVTIAGGTIHVIKGNIGAGDHGEAKVLITGGNVTVDDGCIGNSYLTSSKGNHGYNYIEILGGTVSVVKKASGSQSLASAIGGGMGTDVYIHIGGNAKITDAYVEIYPIKPAYYQGAAGIGGGYYGRAYIIIDENAVIGGGAVGVKGSCGAPGIGDGAISAVYVTKGDDCTAKGLDHHNVKSYISITGNANVTAHGGPYGAGIGGGLGNDEINIYISGNVVINAYGGDGYESNITGGSGIGSGYGSYTDYGSGSKRAYASQTELNLVIEIAGGTPTITASGGEGAEAVGAGKSNPSSVDDPLDIRVSIDPAVNITATGSPLPGPGSSLGYGPIYGQTDAISEGSSSLEYVIDGNTYTYSGTIPDYSDSGSTLIIPLDYGFSDSTFVKLSAVLKDDTNNYQSYVVQRYIGDESIFEVGYIDVSFVTSYKVWFSATNGSVSATAGGLDISSGTIVSCGTEVIFTTSGYSDYEIYAVYGATSYGMGVYRTTVTSDVTASFIYTRAYFAVDFSATNGSVSAYVNNVEISSGDKVHTGSVVSFVTFGNSDYELQYVDGVRQDSSGNYRVTVTDNTYVSFVYAKVYFAVDFSATNGSVSAYVNNVEISSGDKVYTGSKVVFTSSANEGYEFSAVSGISINDAGEYVLTIRGDSSVVFEYVPLPVYYEVTSPINIGDELIFTPLEDTTVLEGDPFSFTITPAEGHEDQQFYVFINGVRIIPVNGAYIVDSVLQDMNVTVEFPTAMAAQVNPPMSTDSMVIIGLVVGLVTLFFISLYFRRDDNEETE